MSLNSQTAVPPSDPVNTHYPSPAHPDDSVKSITRSNFKVSTRKLPILKAGPIEAMTNELGINPPEMIFGDNFVTIEHLPSGWGIRFDALDALKGVSRTAEGMLKVAYSAEWQKNRANAADNIKEVHKPFDWSYSTRYLGTPISPSDQPSLSFIPTNNPIPIQLLKRPDPILFFDEVMLYEDELADNGIAMLSCKIRVMPGRILLLCRFFMRLDNVLLRLRDTRVYVDFEREEIIREYVAKEESYETVRMALSGTREDVPAALRDPNRLAELLPQVEKVQEKVDLKAHATLTVRKP